MHFIVVTAERQENLSNIATKKKGIKEYHGKINQCKTKVFICDKQQINAKTVLNGTRSNTVHNFVFTWEVKYYVTEKARRI